MSRKSRSKKDQQIDFLEDLLQNNSLAIQEGPQKKSRKHWSVHDLKDVKPLTFPQEQMMNAYMQGSHIVADGSAGTGKSLVAIYLALNDVLSKANNRHKIMIVRSIVPSRDIGFLPGTEEEKMEPYENPYRDIFDFLLGKNNSYDKMKEAGIVEFTPTSFLRGMTFDDSVIIVDEIQNMNIQEIVTVLTRVGTNSRIIAIGDHIQNDLYRNKYDASGITQFLKIVEKMKSFDHVLFRKEDIVRSDFVKEFLMAYEDVMGNQ